MRTLAPKELYAVSGGKELTNAEATNAYMMGGSMFFPVIGVAIFKNLYPSLSSLSLLGALAEASIICAGTGIGVWVGYQIYYSIYDE